MTKARTPGERELVRVIQAGIAQAEAAGRVIDRNTARRIAAAVHRGLGGELERFAATGKLRHHHAARLELFATLQDEPRFSGWRAALRAFINEDARLRRGLPVKPGTRERREAAPLGSGGKLPQVNPDVADCERCDPEGVLAYVRADPGDDATRQGLALHRQHQACRWFTRHRLRKHLEATFMDNPRSRRSGLRRLVAHLAVCHNRRVVVQRLDRLPPGSPEVNRVLAGGARVLSASEQNPRSSRRQALLNRDASGMADPGSKPAGRSRS
jgi:DNA invertase Pin-like site-specific DNA recombinase